MRALPQSMSGRSMARLAATSLICTIVIALAGPVPKAPALGAGTNHLAVIVMENKEYADVIGNSAAPYINDALRPNGKLFTSDYAVTHPSLPNYLVLAGGTMGNCFTDQCPPGSVPTENVFHQMNRASVTWKIYAESMPSNCDSASSGPYLARHNPGPYYGNLGQQGDGSCLTNDVPYGQLANDIAAGELPEFIWITPNQYHDMHTDAAADPCNLGSVTDDEVCQGDTWLRDNLPPLLSDGGMNDVTALVVFDEGTSNRAGGGHVAMLEIGPNVCSGCTSSKMITHYGVVEAIDGWFGLPPLSPREPNL